MKRNCILLILLFIGLPSGAQSSSRNEEEAKLVIDSLYTVLAKGGDFKSLANVYSEDPGTRGKGGMYGNVEMGSFAPEFENTVLRINLMEISKPFKTEFGYHVIQVLKRDDQKYSVRHILIKFQ